MTLLAFAFGILGAILASFIGVLSERLYTGERWASDRSRCNSCSTQLGLLDLVPVASWLSTYGRCGYCGIRLPLSYVVTEAALGILFALSYLTFGLAPVLMPFLGALCVLAFIVLYDMRHTIVPPAASTLFVALSVTASYLSSFDIRDFGLTLLFAGIIGTAFFLFHALSRGRLMGLGDSPVALGLALLVGFAAAFPGLIFSFWIGALCGIAILVATPKGHRIGIEVPFVPFLAAGFLLAFFTQWNPFLF
ncbi:MAG: prepilin peptidase [Patescibacteria group bacterium]